MKKIGLGVILISILVLGCKETKKTQSENTTELSEKKPLVQKPNLKIIPIAHATMVLEWEGVTIYVDPVGGPEAFVSQKDPDLILITDIHGDHFNMETLQGLNTMKSKIVVPQAVADKMTDEFVPQLDILNNGETKERYEITIEAVPMYNLRAEALKFHKKGRGNGYVLTKGGQSLYFSGDTEDIPEMRALKNIDKAFICMNLPYTMTEESAASAVLAFQPKQVYPYHYRGRPNVSDVTKFKKIVNDGNDNIEVVQLDWYPNEDY
ncbi:MBL fold metallo-hydrolase [Maribacter sp. R77961]|uniref:MBL fold metallo-hydrolase n=1 Tax=Maribacter sp. R77961 TaxID=3093871 RepID=UPI0037CA6409